MVEALPRRSWKRLALALGKYSPFIPLTALDVPGRLSQDEGSKFNGFI